jgi:hypothetical protein
MGNKVKVTRLEGTEFTYRLDFEDGTSETFSYSGFTQIDADIDALKRAAEIMLKRMQFSVELSNGTDTVTLGTGIFSIASHEFIVTHKDGAQETIWSGPWNDYTPEEELAHALEAIEKGQTK